LRSYLWRVGQNYPSNNLRKTKRGQIEVKCVQSSSWQRSRKDALCGMRKISRDVCGDLLVCLIFAMVIWLGSWLLIRGKAPSTPVVRILPTFLDFYKVDNYAHLCLSVRKSHCADLCLNVKHFFRNVFKLKSFIKYVFRILIVEICGAFFSLTGVVHSKNKFEVLNDIDEVCQDTFVSLSVHILMQRINFKNWNSTK
jgi:hypothetical protein